MDLRKKNIILASAIALFAVFLYAYSMLKVILSAPGQ
jgi:hypothetical protein